MAESKKITLRNSYGAALKELGASAPDVVVLTADLADATKTDAFKEAFPDRFVECGIAESNMVGIAAGLSLMGLVPFVSSFAMFLAGRAYDQVRNSVAYPHLNVKLVATHAGITTGPDGATHQCLEDIALMRAIPGMLVMSPSDDIETRQMIRAAYEYVGPVYIRIGRPDVAGYHDDGYEFRIGRGEVVTEGDDLAIIATGVVVSEAIQAARALREDGISARVINMPTIKPLDEELVIQAAKDCRNIMTVEDHNIYGGLGEAVCGVLSENYPVPVKRVGVNDRFGYSAKPDELMKAFGLTAEGIYDAARRFV